MRLWILAFILAGCAATPPAEEASCVGPLDQPGIQLVEPTFDPIAGLVDADPWDFNTYNIRTCTLPAIGHTTLRDSGPHRYIGEIDMRGDLNLGAVAVLGNGEEPMVYLVDITERARPIVVGTVAQQGTYITDVKISDDGGLLLTASQTVPSAGELAGLAELNGPNGFTVYDIRDPANPVVRLTVPQPQDIGCHMISHHIVQGTDVVMCAGQAVHVFALDRVGDQIATRGHVDYLPERNGVPTPTGSRLAGAHRLAPDAFLEYPHDMTIVDDPEGPMMTVAHWTAGVRLVDLTNAPTVEELGAWMGEGAKHYNGDVHSAQSFWVGDTRYIIASPEMRSSGNIPSMWVLDATNPADMRLVAEWVPPGGRTSDADNTGSGLFLTTHQWQVAPTGDVSPDDVRIYLTMNHGGIWVLDFGAILDGRDAVLGFNLARTPLEEASSVGNAVLSSWDVNVVDGFIYASDRATGLWVFQYEGDRAGDQRLTGFA